MLAESRVFHFGSLSCTDEPARTATQKAAAYVRAHGRLVTYDPNYRAPLWKTEQEAREQILWGLSQADIVKISDEETQFLWDCGPEEGAERVLGLGAKLVMVTLGPKGCLLKNKQADFSCGCPKVHPIDTTGAGDIFGRRTHTDTDPTFGRRKRHSRPGNAASVLQLTLFFSAP